MTSIVWFHLDLRLTDDPAPQVAEVFRSNNCNVLIPERRLVAFAGNPAAAR